MLAEDSVESSELERKNPGAETAERPGQRRLNNLSHLSNRNAPKSCKRSGLALTALLCCVLGLGGPKTLHVELGRKQHQRRPLQSPSNEKPAHLQLLALENVTIGASRLAGAGRDGSVEASGLELGLEEGVDLGRLLALGEHAENVSRLGLRLGILNGGILGL